MNFHRLRRVVAAVILLGLLILTAGLPPVRDLAYSQGPSVPIESDNPLVLRQGEWISQSAPLASGGGYLYNAVPTSAIFETTPANMPTLMLDFTGPSVEIIYATGPALGIVAIEVDGVVLRTIITAADTAQFQQRVIIDYLTDEAHTLRVYPTQGIIAVDAFIAQLPEPNTIGASSPTCPPNNAPVLLQYDPSGMIVPETVGAVALSENGRYAVFASYSNALVPNDSNGTQDIFVRDLQTCTTELISVTPTGVSGNGPSWGDSVISSDGRYVAFNSSATDLVPGLTFSRLYPQQIYVRDRQTGITTIASISTSGETANSWAQGQSLSADGRFVTFVSPANNLDPSDHNHCPNYLPYPSCPDVFLRDQVAQTTTIISRNAAGIQGNDDVQDAKISADGNWITYQSVATNLVPGDTNGVADVFLYDRLANQTTRISVASDGTQANGPSHPTALSSDGRYIALLSSATNLVPDDLNDADDAFVYDRVTGVMRRVSVASNGDEANDHSDWALMSSDGRYVTFSTDATNVAVGDTAYTDAFIHDLQTGETRWVTEGIGTFAFVVALSGDGQWIGFITPARLHTDDINEIWEVYIAPLTGLPYHLAPSGDTLAIFNSDTNMMSRVNTITWAVPPEFHTIYPTGRTTTGQWVMGDWDGDGHDTPAQFRLGAMIYTNDQTTTTNWTGIWLGPNGYPVAGRFDPAVNHDCVGVVDSFPFPPYGTGFALYFTCDLTSGVTPPLDVQWLSVLLPDAQGFTGTHQFSAGDFDEDGVDTIAVRRGRYISWTNVHPTELLSAFDQAQYFRPVVPDDPEGYFVVGDWDLDGIDTFGYYYPNGNFYYRINLLWNTATYLYQEVGLPIDTPTTATSWR